MTEETSPTERTNEETARNEAPMNPAALDAQVVAAALIIPKLPPYTGD